MAANGGGNCCCIGGDRCWAAGSGVGVDSSITNSDHLDAVGGVCAEPSDRRARGEGCVIAADLGIAAIEDLNGV